MRKLRAAALILAAVLLLGILSGCGGADGSEMLTAGMSGTITENPADDIASAAPDGLSGSEDVELGGITDAADSGEPNGVDDAPKGVELPEIGGSYYDLENVVLYIELYGSLPDNYITKAEARELGWTGGSVEDYLEGAAIGGDTFGNREGLLPEAEGRTYTECDIDTLGYGSRGSRRLVFSSDGLYYYTSDHYESFSEVTVTDGYEVIW